MKQTQRQSSWSFNLHDDLSDYSDDEVVDPASPTATVQPNITNGGTNSSSMTEYDVLIAEAEKEYMDRTESSTEIFDIGDIDEGHVKFVETPFTIAKRVPVTKPRAQSGGATNSQTKNLASADIELDQQAQVAKE
ncbi:hypothetical protein OIO90_001472 [Microbotryomycetes sp. JL221]|nr:hypothetical protein OIO90_001472 [Microbotryomycetes sp. JL221]